MSANTSRLEALLRQLQSRQAINTATITPIITTPTITTPIITTPTIFTTNFIPAASQATSTRISTRPKPKHVKEVQDSVLLLDDEFANRNAALEQQLAQLRQLAQAGLETPAEVAIRRSAILEERAQLAAEMASRLRSFALDYWQLEQGLLLKAVAPADRYQHERQLANVRNLIAHTNDTADRAEEMARRGRLDMLPKVVAVCPMAQAGPMAQEGPVVQAGPLVQAVPVGPIKRWNTSGPSGSSKLKGSRKRKGSGKRKGFGKRKGIGKRKGPSRRMNPSRLRHQRRCRGQSFRQWVKLAFVFEGKVCLPR